MLVFQFAFKDRPGVRKGPGTDVRIEEIVINSVSARYTVGDGGYLHLRIDMAKAGRLNLRLFDPAGKSAKGNLAPLDCQEGGNEFSIRIPLPEGLWSFTLTPAFSGGDAVGGNFLVYGESIKNLRVGYPVNSSQSLRELLIFFDSMADQNVEISVFNSIGQIMVPALNKHYDAGQIKDVIYFDSMPGAIPSGAYFVKMRSLSDAGNTATSLFIVN